LLKWAAIAVAACLVLLLASGAVWEQVERRHVAAAHPAPGRLVDIGGRRMQIDCRGAGSPTVVFETGLDYFGALAWSKVLDPVSKLTRACAYSRAGVVWSDDKRGPHDGLGVAHDLHATLAAAGETPPLVLVGLSLGGPYITTYTGLYGDQVAGLVYVDATHPDPQQRLEAALGNPPAGGLTGFVQDLGGLLSWTGAPRLIAYRARHAHAETLATMSPQVREIGLEYFATSLGAMASERDARAKTTQEAWAHHQPGARPVVVLTHGKPMSDMSAAQAARFEPVFLELQQDMASWSSQGVQRTIRGSGHYIADDDPAAVIAAIRDVVQAVRAHPGR
jgi:pimeloyl-ACP methyl ester carboxylesterase